MCLKRLLTRRWWGVGLAFAVGLVLSRCSDRPKPTSPCQATQTVSAELLTSPVYSPIDTSVYYFDTGAPESYFEDFRNCRASPFRRVVPAGIYRVRLDDDSPAELVLAEANLPRISPDGSTMYCIRGAMGAGEIWKLSLPNGQPELVKGGDLWSQSWYGSDTLLVMSWEYGISLLDIRGDSLIDLHINGHSPDVSVDKKICHIWGGGGDIYVFDSAGDRLLRPDSWVANPRWSPDGREIVFQGGSYVHVRVIDLAGRERQLSSGGETEPTFTADGKNIIYVKRTRVGSPIVLDGQIWIMSAKDGSGKRPVTTWARIRPGIPD